MAAFLDGRLPWLAIAAVVAETLATHDGAALSAVEDVLEADRTARAKALVAVERREKAA